MRGGMKCPLLWLEIKSEQPFYWRSERQVASSCAERHKKSMQRTCSMPGCSVLYSGLLSTCSLMTGKELRTCSARRSSGGPSSSMGALSFSETPNRERGWVACAKTMLFDVTRGDSLAQWRSAQLESEWTQVWILFALPFSSSVVVSEYCLVALSPIPYLPMVSRHCLVTLPPSPPPPLNGYGHCMETFSPPSPPPNSQRTKGCVTTTSLKRQNHLGGEK